MAAFFVFDGDLAPMATTKTTKNLPKAAAPKAGTAKSAKTGVEADALTIAPIEL